MAPSEKDWEEIIAQLRHRLREYERAKPWLFRGGTVDDAVQQSITCFLAKSRLDMDRSATLKLLQKIARDFIIDRVRKLSREDLMSDFPPESLSVAPKPWLK